jgi:tetratricopeptide (TPR) repeat protein
MKAAVLSLAVSLCLSPLQAERILIAAPKDKLPTDLLSFGARPAVLEAYPAALSESTTVVVLADRLAPPEREEMISWLRRKFSSLRRKESLAVMVARGELVGRLPAARSFTALEQNLRAALNDENGPGPEPIRPLRLYEVLAAAIPAERDDWSELVWAGRLPPVPDGVLRDYVPARLLRLLGEARVCLSVWPPQDVPWLPATRGLPSGKVVEIRWEAEPVPFGFEIRGANYNGLPLLYVASEPGFPLPSFEALGSLVEAAAAAQKESAGGAELAALGKAIAVFPNWVEALSSGASLAERLGDWTSAASFLAALNRQFPEDKSLLRRYAVSLSESGRPEVAEPVLRRALEAFPRDAELLERLARCRIAQNDRVSGYRLLRETLEVNRNDAALWWMAADLARQLNDSAGERDALREALRLEPNRAERRARFIALALEADDKAGALEALVAGEGTVPEETALLEQYARAWEAVGEPSRALRLWRRAAAVDPKLETAYVSIARLSAAAGDWEQSLKAALDGLAECPDSSQLHVARGRALVELGRPQEARAAVREASQRIQQVALLRLRAEVEDLFGGDQAGEAWDRYLKALPAAEDGASERERALRRATFSALRDGRVAEAMRLKGLPEEKETAELGHSENAVLIPGGVKVLSYLSGLGGPNDPQAYLIAFARGVAAQAAVSESEWEKRTEALIEHYDRLLKVRRFGQTANLVTTVTIETKSEADRDRARRILELLGYRLRRHRGGLRVEMPDEKTFAIRQQLASALELDERRMQQAIESGQPFSFVVADEVSPLVLGEKAWAELLARHRNPLGFAGMLAKDPRAARLYAGLASTGPGVAEALARRLGLRRLAGEYADLLFLYGPALTLDGNGRCPVPGGGNAEAVWQELVGVSPREGSRFIESLLRKHDGDLLAFFSLLHTVTPERQRWFLQTAERARSFYELMRDAPEWSRGADRRVRKSPIADLFRDLPLGDDGRVQFPGGPEVWQVARGTGELSGITRLAKRAQRAKPAEEEAIVERLARERYRVVDRRSQLENFLAVAQIERALGRELEPRESLILSQQFARYEWAFPFLTALPALGEREFLAFFSMLSAIPDDKIEANFILGLWENIVFLEGLLVRAERLSAPDSASIFLGICEGLRRAGNREARGVAAAKALRSLAAALGAGPERLQQAVEDALLGPAGSALGERHRNAFRKVLELQRIPSIDLLLALFSAAETASRGAREAQEAANAVEQAIPALVVLAPPRGARMSALVKDYLQSWQTTQLARIARNLRARAARRRPNLRDIERLSAELCRSLTPWLELALRGLVQSLFLRPEDLPVSEDPLLVRKYQYLELRDSQSGYFPPPDFSSDTFGIGGVPKGSLAGFASIAGQIASAGRRAAKQNSEAVETRQLGAIRNALFWRLSEEDLRAVHLAVLAGREWVVDAAHSSEHGDRLLEASTGLVSAERRTRLAQVLARLRSAHSGETFIGARQYASLWNAAWEALSVSDLYWLGRMRPQGSENSVAWSALKRLPQRHLERSAVHELGIVPLVISRSFVPRLRPLPPYEEFTVRMMPDHLAERLAELPLSLACAIDQAGLPAEAFGLIAETMARRLLGQLEMADPWDFSPVVRIWKQTTAADAALVYAQEAGKLP